MTLSRNYVLLFVFMFLALGSYLVAQTLAAGGTAYTLTSSLADGSTITGKVVWTVNVTPAPYEVDFYVDGIKDAHTESYPPYQYRGDPSGVLDTTQLSNGKHTFQEVAIFDKGAGANLTTPYVQSLATETASHTLNISNGATGTTTPTVSLSASPTNLSVGQTSTLNWSAANASSCIASGAWSGTKATSGTVTTSAITANSAYTLTCTGTGGSATASTTVTVGSVSVSTTCTQVLAAGASILNAYNAAHAGNTLCLPPNSIYTGDIDFRYSIGTASAPITITSQNPSQPGTIKGRIVTHPGANYLTLSYLKLDGISASGNPSPTVSSDHFSLLYNDITDENTSICVNAIDDPTYGTAHYTLIDHNRIHNCGPRPSTNRAHGIYDIGYYTTITNNYIYDNVDRGIQLRMDHNAVVKYNVSDGNGEGMIIGDSSSSAINDEIAYNIFSNSNIRYNIEYYWPSGTSGISGNTIHDNCVWTTAGGTYAQNNSIQPGFVGASLSNNIFANPQYVNRAAKDFTLTAGSACAAYGPRP